MSDSVQSSRPAVAFVAVGSNIEPLHNIPLALQHLLQSVTVTGTSTFYQTVPIGPPGQPPFVNGVWQIRTDLSPVQVTSQVLHPIEYRLGRRRTGDKFAARPLDLDLILYNDWTVQDDRLQLPHPDLVRPFVSMPIRELLDAAALTPELAYRIKTLLPSGPETPDWGTPLERLTRVLRQEIQG